MADKPKVTIRNVTPEYLGTGKNRAPNPGYDKAPVVHDKVDMAQPQYPADFASRLKGKPGNINAQSQLRKSRELE